MNALLVTKKVTFGWDVLRGVQLSDNQLAAELVYTVLSARMSARGQKGESRPGRGAAKPYFAACGQDLGARVASVAAVVAHV